MQPANSSWTNRYLWFAVSVLCLVSVAPLCGARVRPDPKARLLLTENKYATELLSIFGDIQSRFESPTAHRASWIQNLRATNLSTEVRLADTLAGKYAY